MMPMNATAENILRAIERDGVSQDLPPVTPASDAVRALADERRRIAAERYDAARTKDEIAKARVVAGAKVRDTEAAGELVLDRDCAQEVAQDETAHRARASERRELRDVIDLEQLRTTTDPNEILTLVSDAARAGVEEAAGKIARPRLQALALAEARANILNGPCFRALCRLGKQSAPTDRAAIIEKYENKKKRLRQLIAQIANVGGLDDQMKAAAIRAVAPEPETKSTMTVGKWWDDHPQQQGR
jgi:hypothetical protein